MFVMQICGIARTWREYSDLFSEVIYHLGHVMIKVLLQQTRDTVTHLRQLKRATNADSALSELIILMVSYHANHQEILETALTKAENYLDVEARDQLVLQLHDAAEKMAIASDWEKKLLLLFQSLDQWMSDLLSLTLIYVRTLNRVQLDELDNRSLWHREQLYLATIADDGCPMKMLSVYVNHYYTILADYVTDARHRLSNNGDEAHPHILSQQLCDAKRKREV